MAAPKVAVAYSGGRDSTALLHATLVSAAEQGLAEVLALHVHHGLSPQADAWLAHGQDQCQRWARRGLPVRFVSVRLAGGPGPGESIEAWARSQRYAALTDMARHHGAALVLLAHHRRDQAETFLLQALRGAGVAGLAGMPASVERGGIRWARPWLGQPREAIEAYVRRHRLKHIEDVSNADVRHARNRLRLQVWPALLSAFPASESVLSEAAAWAQEARACLDELARHDLAGIAPSDGLRVREWLKLTPPRRSNALRAWLHQAGGGAAPASLVKRLMGELPQAPQGAWPAAQGEWRCHRGVLRHVALPGPAAPRPAPERGLHILRAGRYPLPGWRGHLQVVRTRENGVPLAWLAQVELRARQGREQFQAGIGRPPRSLKKQFQAAGIAAWDRDGPLLFSGGQLVFVPGLGLDARVIALPGQPQVTLTWVPDTPSPG